MKLRTGWFGLLLLLVSIGKTASGITFDQVVTLGDSLLDDPDGNRSPVAAEHIAERLGAPLTKFAQSGASSHEMIVNGQHTRAANQFGAGDLAMLWIGGNDFFDDAMNVAFGETDFLNILEANTDTAMATLQSAGLEVVAFNLPDMSQVPGVIQAVTLGTLGIPFLREAAFRNITDATAEWNTRLQKIADRYDATVVDVFSRFNDLANDPGDSAILGHVPILNDDTGCQFCVFYDDPLLPDVHPSAFAQGWIANDTIEIMNNVFDPNGSMPLELLSPIEIAHLAELIAGDFDEDGFVGAEDLKTWQTNFGATGDLTHDKGDANGDGIVDGRDFLTWQQQYDGSQNSPMTASQVPEPGTLLLAIGAQLVCFLRIASAKRQRQRQNSR